VNHDIEDKVTNAGLTIAPCQTLIKSVPQNNKLMNVQMTGRIISVGDMENFGRSNVVMLLIAEEGDALSILPVEFHDENIQQTTMVLPGQKVAVNFQITRKEYKGKKGETKHLARLEGSAITPVAE